jgi:hypothetical protein
VEAQCTDQQGDTDDAIASDHYCANTVSRANDAVAGPPEIISVTMSPTSMIVTAIANTSDPNGSPTRWATISA